MAEPEVAGIGAVLKPSTPYLKFVDFHPRGAAALSGKVDLSICAKPADADILLSLRRFSKMTLWSRSIMWSVSILSMRRNQLRKLTRGCFQDVKGMTPQDVAPLIRGPVGSRIELELLREGDRQTRTVVLTRQKIEQAGPVSDPNKGGVRQAIGEFFRPAGAGGTPAASAGSKSLQISAPFNFQHRVHVQVRCMHCTSRQLHCRLRDSLCAQ
jgi:hypothetical protein